jgi:hypothetical protein
MQLVLDSSLRSMHYAGAAVVVFVLLLMTGCCIAAAYTQVSKAQTPRHAYRWLQRLHANMSVYRSLVHQPPLDQSTDPGGGPRFWQHGLLNSTFIALLGRFKQPVCRSYQSQLQRQFF